MALQGLGRAKEIQQQMHDQLIAKPLANKVSYDGDGSLNVVDFVPEKLFRSTQSFSAALNYALSPLGEKPNEGVAKKATTEKIGLSIIDGEFT
jgi:hypothetical protein